MCTSIPRCFRLYWFGTGQSTLTVRVLSESKHCMINGASKGNNTKEDMSRGLEVNIRNVNIKENVQGYEHITSPLLLFFCSSTVIITRYKQILEDKSCRSLCSEFILPAPTSPMFHWLHVSPLSLQNLVCHFPIACLAFCLIS